MAIVAERSYWAQDVPREVESERLACIEGAGDPLTIRRLDSTGIGTGWRCLEVGAGRGSIARWMAHRVGPLGSVVASDADTRLLGPLDDEPNVEVRRVDITTDDLEADTFDIVHCRLVLMHVDQPLQAIKRMIASLRPGGWLVCEEDEFFEGQTLTPVHPAAGSYMRAWDAMRRFLAGSMDVHFGQKLLRIGPTLLLDDFRAESTRQFAPGGAPAPRAFRKTCEMFRDQVLLSTELGPSDLDMLGAALEDPSFICASPISCAIFGRKPE